MDSGGGVYQHVKVSVLPLLCDESQRQLCFCVCDYFLCVFSGDVACVYICCM